MRWKEIRINDVLTLVVLVIGLCYLIDMLLTPGYEEEPRIEASPVNGVLDKERRDSAAVEYYDGKPTSKADLPPPPARPEPPTFGRPLPDSYFELKKKQEEPAVPTVPLPAGVR